MNQEQNKPIIAAGAERILRHYLRHYQVLELARMQQSNGVSPRISGIDLAMQETGFDPDKTHKWWLENLAVVSADPTKVYQGDELISMTGLYGHALGSEVPEWLSVFYRTVQAHTTPEDRRNPRFGHLFRSLPSEA